MVQPAPPNFSRSRPSRGMVIALYLFFFAGVGRTWEALLASPVPQSRLGWILGLESIFILLYTLVVWRFPIQSPWLYPYFGTQSALIVAMLALSPQLDFVTMFFLLLADQSARLLSRQARWNWVISFSVLTAGSLIVFLGVLKGLALGLVIIAGLFVITAYVITLQELESAQARSQSMLRELQTTQAQLEQYASQVEELSSIEERDRLAREMHESVSQTLFSIQLNARAVQLLIEKNPAGVRAQLELLQRLTQSALAEMRSLITQLRLPQDK